MNETIISMLPAPAGLMVHYYATPTECEDAPTTRTPAASLALVEWTDDTGTTRRQIEVMIVNPDGALSRAVDNHNVAFVEFE